MTPHIGTDRAAGVAQVLDLVLPCLDEALAIPSVLDRLPAGVRALVVDNGSRDGSAELARTHGATVVACAQRGYGAACHAGLLAARAEYVGFCDLDGSLNLRDCLLLLEIVRAGADLAVCRRRPVNRAAWPMLPRLANMELARRVRKRTGQRIQDVGPLRIARREPLLGLGIADRRSGYPVETILRASDAGWTITGVDVDYYPRIGRSKVTGTVRGTLTAVHDMSAVLRA